MMVLRPWRRSISQRLWLPFPNDRYLWGLGLYMVRTISRGRSRTPFCFWLPKWLCLIHRNWGLYRRHFCLGRTKHLLSYWWLWSLMAESLSAQTRRYSLHKGGRSTIPYIYNSWRGVVSQALNCRIGISTRWNLFRRTLRLGERLGLAGWWGSTRR